MSRAAALCLASLALPGGLHAEGARQVFSCTGADGAAVEFVIAPESLDDLGRGPIVVSYDGESFPGVASSHRGPFQFGTETDHFALLIQGATSDGTLVVNLHHATDTTSTTTPFTCETDF